MNRESPLSPRRSDVPTRAAATHLLVIGTNHRSSRLEARERLLRKASYASLRKAGGPRPPWSDVVLLTTCNRIEVYALTEDPARAAELVRKTLGVSLDERMLYVLEDRDAAAHLIRVASGLDSLAEGEEQVTAQVRSAPSRRPTRASERHLAATAVRRPLITKQMVRAAIRRRQGRPMWLIDLGFPRNVDPGCRGLPGVHLLDLDGLAPWGQRPPSPAAFARVDHRIRKESERLIESLRPEAFVDVAALRKTAEAVRRLELEEAFARLPDLSEEDRAIVDKLSMRLVNRFLHGPTERLRSLPEERRAEIF